MLENYHPIYDATVVSRLKEAGAVIIGKTNMEEFAMGALGLGSIHGPMRNVWLSDIPQVAIHEISDSRVAMSADGVLFLSESEPSEAEAIDWYIAGGSSGGSALAVASGAVFAAIGSDTGGSTRNPAAYCGVVGYKPSYGLVSRHGLISLTNSLDVPGIIARCVEDVWTVLRATGGSDFTYDSTSVSSLFDEPDVPWNLPAGDSLTGVTVGIPEEYHVGGMSAEVLSTWDQVAGLIEDEGGTVVRVSLPHSDLALPTYAVLNACEVASNFARYDGIEFGHREPNQEASTEQLMAASRKYGFGDIVRGRILAGNFFLLKENFQQYLQQALKIRRLIQRDFQRVFASGCDFLLTPVTLSDAPTRNEVAENEKELFTSTMPDVCTMPANMAGLPAVSVPITLSKRGLPISLQLMGGYLEDRKLLTFARNLQNRLNFPQLILRDGVDNIAV
ncbi:unnamed protein product [Cyprideis torosa]|uniref:Glutamyl-tRNA(Gln) amidotransferase subunit A, mitochondrial n=1 Tax=Cyprideis torosa TaxID=163714 RepID=A0A7R8W735_9CRUS|nr:unnamed protein product [Cyprideis torosa]CAG0884729.1 unnamed protein product [Cyprideis torosa]